MGEVYCLYSSEDGVPRYVRATDRTSDKEWKKHLSDALDLVGGTLEEWMREVMRRGHYVGVHVLQTEVITSELGLYEQYWIGQFPMLLNSPATDDTMAALSNIGRQITISIKAKLALQGIEDQPSKPQRDR